MIADHTFILWSIISSDNDFTSSAIRFKMLNVLEMKDFFEKKGLKNFIQCGFYKGESWNFFKISSRESVKIGGILNLDNLFVAEKFLHDH